MENKYVSSLNDEDERQDNPHKWSRSGEKFENISK